VSEYHIQSTTPPTLDNTNAFTINTGTKIYVPYSADHSILSAYQSANIWSYLSSSIEEESE
jgi:hypothetical protein